MSICFQETSDCVISPNLWNKVIDIRHRKRKKKSFSDPEVLELWMYADTIAGSPKANEAAIKLSQPSGQQHDRSRKFSFYFLLCSSPFVFHFLFVFLCLSTKLPAGFQQALTTVVVIYIFRSIWFPFEAITFVFRVDIWCNQRMCKIPASSVIFFQKQHDLWRTWKYK